MKFETNGIDEMINELNRIRKKTSEAAAPQTYRLEEILTDEFIRENTKFPSLKAFMLAGEIKDEEDFLSDRITLFIRQNSQFESFDDMHETAAQEVLIRKLDEHVGW